MSFRKFPTKWHEIPFRRTIDFKRLSHEKENEQFSSSPRWIDFFRIFRQISCFSSHDCRKQFVGANDTWERFRCFGNRKCDQQKACFRRWTEGNTLWHVFMKRDGNLFVFGRKSKRKVYRARPLKGSKVPWHDRTKIPLLLPVNSMGIQTRFFLQCMANSLEYAETLKFNTVCFRTLFISTHQIKRKKLLVLR